jgi:hypothetical protein
MRAGMQALLRQLRDQPQPSCMAESEWRDVLAIAREENLLAWLATHLSSAPSQLPPAIGASIAEMRRQARHEAFLWSATLRQTLSAFHERGIPVISLKGPWLAERLHGDAAFRSYSDLDFLVRPRDWNTVERTLSESGFSPCDRGDDRHRRWRRAGICVEPHYRLENPLDFDLDTEGLWNRALLSEFRGIPAWLLALSDELMFLCVHAVRHCFERLSLLLDLSLAFRAFPLPDASSFGRRGGELKNVLALSRMLVSRFEDSSAAASPAWSAAHAQLDRIADRIWQRCVLERAAPIDWRTNHRLFLAMEASPWSRFLRRLRNARILRTRLVDSDFDLAARFRLRRTWQVWILRQIRLVCKTVRASLSRTKTPAALPVSRFDKRKTEIILSAKGELHDNFDATAQY